MSWASLLRRLRIGGNLDGSNMAYISTVEMIGILVLSHLVLLWMSEFSSEDL